MNKNLLTLAGILSLLVANQAFGFRSGVIKNETTNTFVAIIHYKGCSKTFVPLKAGQSQTIWFYPACRVSSVSVKDQKENLITEFKSRIDNRGLPIDPEKGLTIKTVDGKTVIVENQ